MTEQTRTKVIGVVLVISAIWAGLNFKSDDVKESKEAPSTIQPLVATDKIVKKTDLFINMKKYESLSWGRSPFYMSSLATIHQPQIMHNDNQTLSWVLSGIVLNKSSAVAIINKRPVKIGESINNAIVTKIGKEKVIIKYNREEITLTVSKG